MLSVAQSDFTSFMRGRFDICLTDNTPTSRLQHFKYVQSFFGRRSRGIITPTARMRKVYFIGLFFGEETAGLADLSYSLIQRVAVMQLKVFSKRHYRKRRRRRSERWATRTSSSERLILRPAPDVSCTYSFYLRCQLVRCHFTCSGLRDLRFVNVILQRGLWSLEWLWGQSV